MERTAKDPPPPGGTKHNSVAPQTLRPILIQGDQDRLSIGSVAEQDMSLDLLHLSFTNNVQIVPQMDLTFGDFMGPALGNFYFDIMAGNDRRIYMAEELSLLGGGSRPFTVNIYDDTEELAFSVTRKGSCCLCWFGARTYGSVVTVARQTGEVLGRVRQLWKFGQLVFRVEDGRGEELGRVEGPRGCVWSTHCISADAKFPLTVPSAPSALSASSATSAPIPKQSLVEVKARTSGLNDEQEDKTTQGSLNRVEVVVLRSKFSRFPDKLQAISPILKGSSSSLHVRVEAGPAGAAGPAGPAWPAGKSLSDAELQRARVSFVEDATPGFSLVQVQALEEAEGGNLASGSAMTLRGSFWSEKSSAWKSKWASLWQCCRRPADVDVPTPTFAFNIDFPLNMSAETKAVVVGAGILINLSFYEERRRQFCNVYGSGCFICELVTILVILEVAIILTYYFLIHSH